MSLKDDVNAGLKAISINNPFTLNGSGECLVYVPIPASIAHLTQAKLAVKVQMSRSGKMFSLYTPLANIKQTLNNAFLETLLQQQYYADRTSGLGFTLHTEGNTLMATYHWILEHISAEDFVALFTQFTVSSLNILREVTVMAHKESALVLIHPVS